MISLGKFLRSPEAADGAVYIRALSLLVQGMEVHTVNYNTEDYEHFRAGLAEVQRSLVPQTAIPELLVLVGGIVKIFEVYNVHTAARLRSQFQELRSIIAAFGGAVATMVSASDGSLVRLRQIQERLEGTEKTDDLRALKTHLCDCLSSMASEVEEHRRASESSMASLARGAQEFEKSVGGIESQVVPDTPTGLPARAAAEAALSKLVDSGTPGVAAIFVLKRLKQMNARSGYEAGNSVLAWFSTYLATGTYPEEGLYRWTGPALLAVITRNVPLLRLRHEIANLIADMPEREVTIGMRVATVPVSVGWTIFPVARPVEKLVRQLEAFVDGQGSEEDSHPSR